MLKTQRKNNHRPKSHAVERPQLWVVDKPVARNTLTRRVKRRVPRYLKAILCLIGAYLLFTFALGGFQIWQLKNELRTLELEQERLLQYQQELQAEIEYLNNPEIIERIARESLGMVKPGETKIIPAIPDGNIPTPKEVAPEDMGD